MPDLEGLTEEQARQVTEAKDLRLSVTTRHHATIGAGRIVAQKPAHGMAASQGAVVFALVSLGPEPEPAASSSVDTIARPDSSNPEPPGETAIGETVTIPPLPVPKEEFLVCIDPGHPSETSSGATANGLSENRLNWQVAQRLAKRLEAMGRLRRLGPQRTQSQCQIWKD